MGRGKARPKNGITNREMEVLQWIFMGKTYKEIGDIMGLSPLTVKQHVRKMMIVSNASTARGLVYTALRRGWLMAPDRSILP